MIPLRVTPEQLLEQIPTMEGRRFVRAARLRGLEIEFYSPEDRDLQTPHDRDEFYVVQAGSGTFLNATDRMPFKAGDLLFVEKGVPHRFEDFTPDFATWVIFLD
ncbi:MAG TPA: cupin domain-containing protein [Holophagaceae bacterium]|nr:cupin domain-containing protein [Holophagaceae bacterium]